MREATIGLAMIVRDAEASLSACLDSVKDHVDQIVIVLAGESKDATEKIARKYTKQVFRFEWVDDFAAARNFSFSKLTTDWNLWLDHDDVVEGAENLRMLVREGERRNFGAYQLLYNYRHDANGRPTVVQNRERLLKRSLGWTWACRVHEYAKTTVPGDYLVGTADDVVIRHTSNTPASDRNFRLLQLMEAEMMPEDPDYSRLLGCLSDYYHSRAEWDKAIEYGVRFFDGIELGVMKWTAATELAKSYIALGRWNEAFNWSTQASLIAPEYALPYLLMARASWFGEQNAEKAWLFLQDADNRHEAPVTVFRHPEDYTKDRWDVEHRVLGAMERYGEAMAVVQHYLDENPGDKAWEYYAWLYREKINCERSVLSAEHLCDHLFRRGDTLAALKVLEALPVSVRNHERILRLQARVRSLTAHVFDDGEYKKFYEAAHSSATDPDHVINATVPEPYRLDPLVARLKKRGAKRVLDVGCGAGEPAIYLAKHGFEVVGLDINRAAIQEARRRAKRVTKGNGLKPYQLEFRVGTFDTVGPENIGKFDAVVMMELIEHILPSQVQFYMASAEDFLRPGGAVYLTTPAMTVGDIPGIWDEFPRDHVKEFTREELAGLLVGPTRRTRLPQSLFKLFDLNVPIPGFGSWFMEYEVYPERPDWPEWDQPVAIFVGPGLEDWNPETPEKRGIGGSETWAAKVARELRALGHPVVVYAAADGVWDGVIYQDAAKFNPRAPFAGARAWLCIVSRHLEVLDERLDAEHVLFVAHDTDYADATTPARIANLDAYCVMSEWQREHTIKQYAKALPVIGAKLAVIQNGIEPEYFEGEEKRVPHSFIWSSSPDRGLDVLLEWWPDIRKMWPDATLDVFYGFENMRALTPGRPWLPPFIEKVEGLMRQEGVKNHGRIGQRALAREFMKHQFWLYPSVDAFGQPWHETFCITAVEAAAGGCIGIFPSVGALVERPGLRFPEEQGNLTDALGVLAALDVRGGSNHLSDLPSYSWRRAAEVLLEAVTAPVEAKELVRA